MAADPSLRTFRGRSLEEVLPQIRAELGPDAVVVRQREGLMGGIGGFFQQQFVEVQARPGAQRIDLYDEAPATPAAPPATPAPAPPAPSAAAPAPEPAAETPQERPAAPAQLSAAELLRAATGGAAGDGRTPAEILREHSDTFARQLAAAEERAEPTVARAQPAPRPAAEEPEIPQRRAYATPRQETPAPAAPQPAAAADEPIPLPQRPAPAPVPAPAPDLPPAAAAPVESAPAAVNGSAAVNGTAAARPAKRRAARARARTPARARARAQARARARARAARASRAAPKAKAVEPAPAPQPAPAPALVDDPEPTDGGVGPQTAHALELAAAIAASVGAPRALPASASSAGSAAGGGAGAELVPAGAAAAALPAPAPAVLPGISAPRRSLFGRRGRRGGPTTPRVVAGGPEAALVVDQLETFGLAPAATEELLLDATAHVLPFTAGSDVRSAIRSALARRIPTLPPPRIGGRAVAFVGAGGGGKTRCTAGLVAAYAQGSTLPVACVTLAPADGGAELSGLLKPHGVRVEVADSAERAAERIAALRGEAVVVLDTPPAAPADQAAIEALSAALAPMELDEIQLVVPATLSAAVAQELVERLSPLGATGITMTHADETDHIGAVVELSCATRLPLSYVNSGLALPGALVPADPVALAERLLP